MGNLSNTKNASNGGMVLSLPLFNVYLLSHQPLAYSFFYCVTYI
jgi:hypothetical protein